MMISITDFRFESSKIVHMPGSLPDFPRESYFKERLARCGSEVMLLYAGARMCIVFRASQTTIQSGDWLPCRSLAVRHSKKTVRDNHPVSLVVFSRRVGDVRLPMALATFGANATH